MEVELGPNNMGLKKRWKWEHLREQIENLGTVVRT
jgi:hypothetical protein